MTTPTTPRETAETAAEAIRALNHHTRPGIAQVDVTEIYDLLAELTMLAGRLPQLLGQLEELVDDLVEHGHVAIAEGDQHGDPVAAAAICGHWLATGRAAADQLAHALEAAQQTLTWAAPTRASS
ncbi:hypothetical protein [Microlunatus sp. Y2014]|uniref:hypothetical protein n=1 Tax=Microlunatus sp. Y2014 TaxID=3418488 RepID=UPI003DA7111F